MRLNAINARSHKFGIFDNMELFEDPILKAKYLKNKLRVKQWESDFMEKYGRRPNKVRYFTSFVLAHIYIVIDIKSAGIRYFDLFVFAQVTR